MIRLKDLWDTLCVNVTSPVSLENRMWRCQTLIKSLSSRLWQNRVLTLRQTPKNLARQLLQRSSPEKKTLTFWISYLKLTKKLEKRVTGEKRSQRRKSRWKLLPMIPKLLVTVSRDKIPLTMQINFYLSLTLKDQDLHVNFNLGSKSQGLNQKSQNLQNHQKSYLRFLKACEG